MGAGKEAREASPRRRALVAAQRSKTKNKNYSDGVSNTNDNERRRDLPSVGKDLGGGGVSAHNLQREKFLECVRARASLRASSARLICAAHPQSRHHPFDPS